MDYALFTSAGLSPSEAKVYVSLLKVGSAKASQIISVSGVVSSAVHRAFSSLKQKGFISFVKKGNVTYYSAVPVRRVSEVMDDRKNQLVLAVEKIRGPANLIQGAEVFEGLPSISAMLTVLVDHAAKNDSLLVFPLEITDQTGKIRSFFKKFDIKRKSLGINGLAIARKSNQEMFLNRKWFQVKYTTNPIPEGVMILGDTVAFISWGEKPVGFLVHSPPIAESFKKLFWSIWEK